MSGELREALEPFARSVFADDTMPSGWRVGYNFTFEQQKAAHLAFYGKPTALAEITGQPAQDNGKRDGLARSPLTDIAGERFRQVQQEGWTPAHDDQHDDGSLALAAALYATPIPLHRVEESASGVRWSDPWPWTKRCWAGREQAGDEMVGRVNEGDGRQKHDARRRLVIAGALIVAEIERLDRATLTAETETA